MLDWIRKFNLKRAGVCSVAVGSVNIIIHLLVIAEIIPCTMSYPDQLYECYFKIKYLTSYLTVTIITSNRMVTYNIIRQTRRRSAYYLIQMLSAAFLLRGMEV